MKSTNQQVKLSNFGYKIGDFDEKRHNDLLNATSQFDHLKIIRHLNFINNFTTNSKNKEIIKADIEFMKTEYSKNIRVD